MHHARFYAQNGKGVVAICSDTHQTADGDTHLSAIHALNKACATRHKKEYSLQEDAAKFYHQRLIEAGRRMTTTRVTFTQEPTRRW